MRQVIERQTAAIQAQLAELKQRLDFYRSIHGVGAAKAASELGQIHLKLAKLLGDEKLSLGDLKPQL
jgi:hypothetical protein